MNHITSYGISLPRYQIENHILHPHMGKRKGKRTIAFSDEDILTLAFDSGCKCLNNQPQRDNIDAVIFASTTPVFENRYHASFLAELLDLEELDDALDDLPVARLFP